MRRQGVPDQLLLDAGLLYRNDRGLGDMMRERVIFPITDRRGRVVAFGGRVIGGGDKGPKYLNSPATAIFDKGATLYGLAQARQAMGEQGRVVVVEGYMDVLAAHQAGIAEVVAPLGTAFTPEQAALLWGMVPRLVLGMDGDRAGLAAARRAVDRLMGEVSPDKALFFAEFPNGKDPADLIFDGQIEAVVKVLDEARSLADLVWQIEAEGADATTPERVAAWEARLLARCGTIKDHATRRAYLAAFRRRFSAGLWGNVSVLRGAAKTRFAPAPGGGRVWEMWERAGERGRADKVRVWLESRAVDCEALDRVLGGIGVAQGKMIKGRVPLGEGWASAAPLSLWEERDDGAGFIVVPVWAEGRDGALIDLIAWDPRSDAVGSYTGACGVLGQDLVDEARAYEVLGIPHQLKVAAGPLSWLRREGRGERAVLVIDWRTAWETLGCLHTLVAEDLETGERLARACRPPKLRTPAIMVEDRP
jgi:DNA primase